MLNQGLFRSIWLLDTIWQVKVPVWCNRSSGGSATVLGGYTNVASGIFALVLQYEWSPSGLWAISKCSANVDSNLFSCSGRPWRSHSVNSIQHPAHEGEGLHRGKIFISSMLPREVTVQSSKAFDLSYIHGHLAKKGSRSQRFLSSPNDPWESYLQSVLTI